MRFHFCCVILILISFGVHASPVTGVVFHDQNGNGVRDAGEPGVPRVAVSNGTDVVTTDREGRCSIEVSAPGIVFMVKPRGWTSSITPNSQKPQFYYLHRPEGSPPVKFGGIPPTGPLPETIHFPLQPRAETGAVRMLVLGDTQVRNTAEVHYLMNDLFAETLELDVSCGLTLGDNVFNELNACEPLSQAIAKTGIPWHFVPGNHDVDYDGPTAQQSFETFQRWLGPSYYAFACANVHVLVLNNVCPHPGLTDYHAELGEEQRTFIKNYLALVPKDAFVVLLMHIPIMNLEDKTALFELIAEYPHCISLSAHWHSHQHFFLGPEEGWPGREAHHHIVQGTACGSWYRGFYDAQGIPEAVMADGTPKGYSLLTIDDSKYEIAYKASRRPASYQMDIHIPKELTVPEQEAGEVVANFFNGTERCRLEMRLNGGAWQPMEQFTGKSPFYMELYERQNQFLKIILKEKGIEEPTEMLLKGIDAIFRPVIGRGMPEPKDTDHLWRAPIPDGLQAGYNLIEVRAHDIFGSTHSSRSYVHVK